MSIDKTPGNYARSIWKETVTRGIEHHPVDVVLHTEHR